MTALLDRAIAAVRRLPPCDQDEIALGLLQKAKPDAIVTPERLVDERGAIAEPEAFRLWPRGTRRRVDASEARRG